MSRASSLIILAFLLGLFGLVPLNGHSQQETPTGNITGSVGFDYQYYTMKTGNGAGSFPRQPKHYARFLANLDFRVNPDFNIPVILRLGNTVFTPLNPSPSNGQNFVDYMLNPQNYIYVAPTYKGFKLELGSQVPYLSELTSGDIQAMGVGATLGSDRFRVMMHYGIAQRPLEGVSYKKNLASLRLEGSMGGRRHTIGFNVVHLRDRTSSVSTPPFPAPVMSAVISVDLALKLGERTTLKLEGANSAHAPNISASNGDPETSAASWLIPTKFFAVSGYAALAELKYRKSNWGFKLSGQWKDADFENVGYFLSRNDLLDALFSPHFRVAGNKLFVRSSFGVRINNFASNGDPEWTLSPLIRLRIYALPADFMDITANYSNYGILNTIEDDATMIKMITHSVLISPTLKKEMWGLMNKLTLGFTYDLFNDYNPQTMAFGDRKTHNKWIAIGVSDDMFSASVSFSSLANKFNSGKVVYNSVTVEGKADLLESRLQPFTVLTFMMPRSGGSQTARKQLYRLGLESEFVEGASALVSFSNHHFVYGTADASPEFNEYTVNFSIKYKIK